AAGARCRQLVHAAASAAIATGSPAPPRAASRSACEDSNDDGSRPGRGSRDAVRCPRSAWPCLNTQQGREGIPAPPSTTGMPTLWIAAFPAVLVLVAAGWM